MLASVDCRSTSMPAGAAFRKERVMVSEDNKAIVLQALRHWNDKNLPAWFDLIHDEATYLLPYLPERFQYGGSYNKTDTIAALTEWRSAFEHFASAAMVSV